MKFRQVFHTFLVCFSRVDQKIVNFSAKNQLCYYNVAPIRNLLFHDKSSSISQLIKGKSRDLQKVVRYLSKIITSMFKGVTGGRIWLVGISLISRLCRSLRSFSCYFLFCIYVIYLVKHYY